MPAGTEVVELGSGDARKTRILLEAMLRRDGRLRYVPIDISTAALDAAARELRAEYPALEVVPVAAEYESALARLFAAADRPKLVLWLGSSIGNLGRAEAAAFLSRVRETLAPADRLLVGIDLRKDRGTLERAYDDSAGVTARFNRNLLVRVNRELGGGFDVAAFRHRAEYRDDVGRVEMHLVSERDVTVPIARLGLDVRFAEGEAIHTENCHKYSPAEIADLAKGARLALESHWLDSRALFSVNVLAP
jgi:dimethylhistidine N-methyltransferase